MLGRSLVLGLVVMGGAIMCIPGFGGAVIMGVNKERFVDTYDRAGLDVSDCRNHPRSLVDPNGGMPDCLQGTFRDAARKLNSGSVDPPAVGEPDLE